MNKGQSLFEVIIAIGVAAVIMTAIAALSTTSVRNSTSGRDNSQANRYAQEAVEWLRSQRDASWSVFKPKASAGGSVYCLPTVSIFPAQGVCNPVNVIPGTIFTRQAKLTLVQTSSPGDTVEAEVTVGWVDSQGSHNVVVTTRFTDWVSLVN